MNQFWQKDVKYQNVVSAIQSGVQHISVSAPVNTGAVSFIAALSRQILRPMLIVVPSDEMASVWARDLRFFLSEEGRGLIQGSSDDEEPSIKDQAGGNVVLFPGLISRDGHPETSVFEAHLASALHAITTHPAPVAIAPVSFLTVRTVSRETYRESHRYLNAGEDISLHELLKDLVSMGYERGLRVEKPGEFSFRGGILDIFGPIYDLPVRLEFFGDEIVSIREFDPLTQRSISRVQRVAVAPLSSTRSETDFPPMLFQLENWFSEDLICLYMARDQITEILSRAGITEISGPIRPETLPGRPVISWEFIEEDTQPSGEAVTLDLAQVPEFHGNFKDFFNSLIQWLNDEYRIRIVYRRESIRQLIEERLISEELDFSSDHQSTVRSETRPKFLPGHLSRGFRSKSLRRIYLSERDIIGEKRIQKWRQRTEEPGLSFRDLKADDFVVHVDHGIGRYKGLTRLVVNGRSRDFLLLEYADRQKLYLPVDRLDLVQRYIADKHAKPALDKLGGTAFKRRKTKVRESVLKLAADLLKLFSQRELIQGYAFPSDDTWQREFEMGFEYEETPDQYKAILDVKQDMEQPKPMDRLVCGDVGYGKTEVAMRAAFKSAVNGKQVAILVPTTILAQQHFNTFLDRFRRFPLKLAMLSRFLKPSDAVRVKKGLENGAVDIVIGTHALLSKDIAFKDLGLVIIDEEQRFGVKHKERLKQLRTRIDVLTLTATPIPRTLNLAMLGLRDMSLINTPPEARHPIITRVTKFDKEKIRTAIMDELARNGQVYFVHNRIQSIYALGDMLKLLVPEATFEIAHGQMSESKLEKIMLRFMEKEFDVLLCTTIIESGLDIPSVNTIFINRADKLGLAQLYQLRGRVGRDRLQAYAYLLVPASKTISAIARERLAAIKDAAELGSGFRLASHDLEIRGAGDILGSNQHGHISAVGFEMYCRLIREAVSELKGVDFEEEFECEMSLPFDTAIPEDYVEDPSHRLALYRRFAMAKHPDSVPALLNEIADMYGELPDAVKDLARFTVIKIKARQLKVSQLDYTHGAVRIIFNEHTRVKPETVTSLLLKSKGKLLFEPPNVMRMPLPEGSSFIIWEAVNALFDQMV